LKQSKKEGGGENLRQGRMYREKAREKKRRKCPRSNWRPAQAAPELSLNTIDQICRDRNRLVKRSTPSEKVFEKKKKVDERAVEATRGWSGNRG